MSTLSIVQIVLTLDGKPYIAQVPSAAERLILSALQMNESGKVLLAALPDGMELVQLGNKTTEQVQP